MEKLESSFKNMVLVLTGISLSAAALLASVYTVTKGPIEEAQAAKQQEAIRLVLPSFDVLADADTVNIEGLGSYVLHRVYKADDTFVGAAVETFSNNAFSGNIKIMVGFDAQGNIVDYSVLEQKETPGLGTKMEDWFKTDKGSQNIKGKNPATDNLSVTKDGGEIDAITAATITSRAFLEAVRNAYAAYAGDDYAIDTQSGATSMAD